MTDLLNTLQEWFLSECDGEWEHESGIKIASLDNPGWEIQIQTLGTSVELSDTEKNMIEVEELDWHCFWVKDGIFTAACGPNNLSQILEIFFHLIGCEIERKK